MIRLDKKQKRAVLDSSGKEIALFNKGYELYALTFVKLYNEELETKLSLFEQEVKKVPWYINLYVELQFKLIDIKHFIKKLCKNGEHKNNKRKNRSNATLCKWW